MDEEAESIATPMGPVTLKSPGGLKMPFVWLGVRLAILTYWAIAGFRGFSQPFPIPTFVLIVAILWGAVVTRYWIARAYTSAHRAEPWLLPSWFVSPFQMSQPFQFFHVGALSFVVYGFAGLAREEFSGRHLSLANWPVEAFAGAFGLGILLGMYWTMAAYRSRFQRIATRKPGP